MEKMGVQEKYFKKISNYFSCFSKFKLERDTIMAALRTVPFRRGNRERRKEKREKSMAKKLELKFLTSANTELIVSIADPKDGLALSAVQAEAAKIMPVLANGKGIGAASFAKAVMVTTTEEEIH